MRERCLQPASAADGAARRRPDMEVVLAGAAFPCHSALVCPPSPLLAALLARQRAATASDPQPAGRSSSEAPGSSGTTKVPLGAALLGGEGAPTEVARERALAGLRAYLAFAYRGEWPPGLEVSARRRRCAPAADPCLFGVCSSSMRLACHPLPSPRQSPLIIAPPQDEALVEQVLVAHALGNAWHLAHSLAAVQVRLPFLSSRATLRAWELAVRMRSNRLAAACLPRLLAGEAPRLVAAGGVTGGAEAAARLAGGDGAVRAALLPLLAAAAAEGGDSASAASSRVEERAPTGRGAAAGAAAAGRAPPCGHTQLLDAAALATERFVRELEAGWALQAAAAAAAGAADSL